MNAVTTLKTISACIMIVFISCIGKHADAQSTGIKRTELSRNNLSVNTVESIQVRIDFKEGAAFGRHSHPGEELIYVIEGVLEYEIEGSPPVRLSAGQVLYVPTEKIHSAKNVGKGNAAELATYIVRKGEPLVKMRE